MAVSKQKRILAVLVPLIIMGGVGVGLLALFRVQQANEFSRPHSIVTPDGTNYVLRLLEAAVGKTDTGCVLIVYLRLENLNPFNLTLERRSFFLADRYRMRYRPSTMGTANELIKLPASGVLEREMLSFTVPEDVFMGRVALLISDRRNRIMIKDETPFLVKLRDGEFRSFRRSSW
jgi:hypothetical protein